MRGWRSRTAGTKRLRARGVALAACLLAALTLAAPGGAEAKKAKKLPNKFFGVDSVLQPSSQEFAQMRNNGAKVFRSAVIWRQVEPNKPFELYGHLVHTYDWSIPDSEMRKIAEAGMTPHVALIGTPSWAGESYQSSPMQTKIGSQSWPAYVAAVLERYGRGGTFWNENPDLKVKAPDAYQIWNEPNSQIAYAPKADPNEYAKLFRLAGKQIRKRDPKATILPGGMFGTPQLEDSLYAWNFLRKFLKAPNVDRYVDGIAVHPYAKALRGVKYQIRKMRKTAHKAGYGKLPLYITEIGWSSEKPNGNIFYKGLKGQAKATKRALSLFVRKQRKWHLKRILWFTWSDVTEKEAIHSGCGFCEKSGLVYRDLSPKPALRYWRKYARKRR